MPIMQQLIFENIRSDAPQSFRMRASLCVLCIVNHAMQVKHCLAKETVGLQLNVKYRYWFAGNAKISHELAEDLLVAADKYDMPRLRRHCEELLTDGLTADNVAETLIFADCYSFHRLRSAAADFLLKNFHQVETTDGWCQLVETCPPLANQLSHSRSTKRQADSNGVEVASENSTKRARLN